MKSVHLPGDVIKSDTNADNKVQIIGCGIERRGGTNGQLVVVQPGIRRIADGKQWMSIHCRRYVPERGDHVLGIIVSAHGESFKVDIGAADMALISFLSFEGATKRNRPNLKIGDLLFAAVAVSSRHMESELSCTDREARARGFGVLPSGGFVFRCSLNLVRRVLSPRSQLLHLIGKDIKFEITCGMNGRIWIKAANRKEICVIYRMIVESEFVREPDIPSFVERHIRILKGFEIDRSSEGLGSNCCIRS